ncbi:hypothetical protein [Aidingimonas halophila]|uniref:Uncharacterized protein n=1 Tax=Aidingimonas halophila TaxID=574349 RepID=A0A1H2S842_9GAMM|nr:hypothetical protein [Aidingimonas halophila]GHC18085.1 hypothetical protein GCM10008094_04780 [Aidingimonas halophila]SDW27708.1 hypothetical protein SAMN05443545_101496 [Aidingimonas halophila]
MTSPIAALIILSIAAGLGLGTAGVMMSDLQWPLSADQLVSAGLFSLTTLVMAGLLFMMGVLIAGLRTQQQAVSAGLEAHNRQLRAAETAQLMERFIHQAEALLDKESLDPNKRSVLRCLAIDALRGNTGRGDPNIGRLARLFEWLASEAELHRNDDTRMRLIDPVLRQYAEIAEQLCHVGEGDPERLAIFLRYQPQPHPDSADKT